MIATPSHTTQQLACQCTKCTQTYGTPPYVDLPSQGHPGHPATRPLYCPRCKPSSDPTRPPKVYRPYDYADVLCTDYIGLTRQVAISLITMLNEFKAQGASRVKQLATVHDPIDYLASRGFQRMSMRDSITPLDVQCLDCAGQYTILRGNITTAQRPPAYCIWCGSSHITTAQENTDDTAYTVLAAHYQLPRNVLEYLYSQYTAQSRQTSFQSYMDSPTILEIRQKLAGLAPTPTTNS